MAPLLYSLLHLTEQLEELGIVDCLCRAGCVRRTSEGRKAPRAVAWHLTQTPSSS